LRPPAPCWRAAEPARALRLAPLCCAERCAAPCPRRLRQGYGTLLMREAERIARCEHRSDKIAVISGVGTRHYYRKLGYELEGAYMVKKLQPAPSRRRRSRRP
jgi:hypothetical protein